jgi:hypothetical protein
MVIRFCHLVKPVWPGLRSLSMGLIVLLVAPAAARSQYVVLTVGPDGDFSTIQQAVDSCPSGVPCAVCVEASNIYTENLVIPPTFVDRMVFVTGGWDPTFTTRDPWADTTIDGGGNGSVVDVRMGDGIFSLDGFRITNGINVEGAGINVDPAAVDAAVRLSHLVVEGNHVVGSGAMFGGGVRASLDESGEYLEVSSCEIRDNSITVVAGQDGAFGAGLAIEAAETATFLVERVSVEANTVSSDTSWKFGAGLFIAVGYWASGEVYDVVVSGNVAAGSTATLGSGGYIWAHDNGQILARRWFCGLNSDQSGVEGPQLFLSSQDSGTIVVTDSLVGLGDRLGVLGNAQQSSKLKLANLTVVDNALTGIKLARSDTATVTLYSSISYGNGTDASLGLGVVTDSNLIGANPVFVSPGPPAYNYHLDDGSPGLDAGNNLPPGGLGSTDLDGRQRIENGVVDIGCYEGAALLFFSGFEWEDTRDWSQSVP